jgi:hypothetical protein
VESTGSESGGGGVGGPAVDGAGRVIELKGGRGGGEGRKRQRRFEAKDMGGKHCGRVREGGETMCAGGWQGGRFGQAGCRVQCGEGQAGGAGPRRAG